MKVKTFIEAGWFLRELYYRTKLRCGGALKADQKENRRLYEYWHQKHEWKAMRVGGGGVFTTHPLRRQEAIDYVTVGGANTLCTVDDENKIIFYRSN